MLDDIIIDSIIYAIKEISKKLKYNKKIEGVVTEVINEFTYKVKIQDNESVIKSINNIEYQVGDVVYIIIFNNNNSDKRILCKK